jgi:hypothetical protein
MTRTICVMVILLSAEMFAILVEPAQHLPVRPLTGAVGLIRKLMMLYGAV